MTFKEITDLIKLVNRTDLSEFKMKNKDLEISIRTSNFQGKNTQVVQAGAPPMIQMPEAAPASAPASAPAAAPAAAPAESKKADDNVESTEGLLEYWWGDSEVLSLFLFMLVLARFQAKKLTK